MTSSHRRVLSGFACLAAASLAAPSFANQPATSTGAASHWDVLCKASSAVIAGASGNVTVGVGQNVTVPVSSPDVTTTCGSQVKTVKCVDGTTSVRAALRPNSVLDLRCLTGKR